jgi:hypothetical protein
LIGTFLGTEDFDELTTVVPHRASSQGGGTLQTADGLCRHSKHYTAAATATFLGTEDFDELTTVVAHRASSQGGGTLQTADLMSARRSYAVNFSVKANYTLNNKTKTKCV